MSIELNLLHTFVNDREKHTLHHLHVDELNLERELKLLFNTIKSYYESYEDEKKISKENLLTYFNLKYPNSKLRDSIVDLIHTAYDLNVNEEMVGELLDQLHEKHTAGKLLEKLLPVVEGDKYGVVASLNEEIAEFSERLHNPDNEYTVPVPCEDDFATLMAEERANPGIPFRIPEVTAEIGGGLRRASLGLVYATPDAGKTGFLINNCAHWADILPEDKVICYAGNEELHRRLKKRAICTFLQQPMKWVLENEEAAKILIEKTNYQRIKFFKDIVSHTQVEYIMRTWKPRIFIIDQAAFVDIKTKRRADGVSYLEQLFRWYRQLANRYDTSLIGVSQGNLPRETKEGEEVQWPTLYDIYGSNIPIQGALDWAIGIGRLSKDPYQQNLRFLSFTKNKFYQGGSGRVTLYFNRLTNEWRMPY